MSELIETESIEYHEKMAKGAFNKTWDFLDKKDRTAEDELNMIQDRKSVV